ncbi:hypothetical protein NHQ30_007694 [Ciborinia camelliae]|nr:hypothetical protein NHQ30_007694 [Ciborinia camelliae]
MTEAAKRTPYTPLFHSPRVDLITRSSNILSDETTQFDYSRHCRHGQEYKCSDRPPGQEKWEVQRRRYAVTHGIDEMPSEYRLMDDFFRDFSMRGANEEVRKAYEESKRLKEEEARRVEKKEYVQDDWKVKYEVKEWAEWFHNIEERDKEDVGTWVLRKPWPWAYDFALPKPGQERPFWCVMTYVNAAHMAVDNLLPTTFSDWFWDIVGGQGGWLYIVDEEKLQIRMDTQKRPTTNLTFFDQGCEEIVVEVGRRGPLFSFPSSDPPGPLVLDDKQHVAKDQKKIPWSYFHNVSNTNWQRIMNWEVEPEEVFCQDIRVLVVMAALMMVAWILGFGWLLWKTVDGWRRRARESWAEETKRGKGEIQRLLREERRVMEAIEDLERKTSSLRRMSDMTEERATDLVMMKKLKELSRRREDFIRAQWRTIHEEIQSAYRAR